MAQGSHKGPAHKGPWGPSIRAQLFVEYFFTFKNIVPEPSILGPEPSQTLDYSPVEACPILSVWRKAGVETQK